MIDRITTASYFVDWAVIPILLLAAFVSDFSVLGQLSKLSAFAFVTAVVAMISVEFGAYTWLQGKRAAKGSIPVWQASLYFLMVLTALRELRGEYIGGGMFGAMGFYYILYIVVHYGFNDGRV